MGDLRYVEPVLLITAAFSHYDAAFDWARERLTQTWGPIALESPQFEFAETDYYIPTMGGPIRIAQMSGQVASFGFVPLIQLAAVLSVSIGLLNLFPIPLLDGGHLLFYIIEGIRGRPLSERAQEVGFRIGLAIVLMLMIFATFNDIVHLTTS